jgi:hypothetical protein
MAEMRLTIETIPEVRDLLVACVKERLLEQSVLSKDWDDSVWGAYREAVEDRRGAVDHFLASGHIDETPEPEQEGMGL